MFPFLSRTTRGGGDLLFGRGSRQEKSHRVACSRTSVRDAAACRLRFLLRVPEKTPPLPEPNENQRHREQLPTSPRGFEQVLAGSRTGGSPSAAEASARRGCEPVAAPRVVTTDTPVQHPRWGAVRRVKTFVVATSSGVAVSQSRSTSRPQRRPPPATSQALAILAAPTDKGGVHIECRAPLREPRPSESMPRKQCV